jgi:hypothetical protein
MGEWMPGCGGHLSMLFGVPVALAFAACFGGLLELVSRWSKQEGFGHAFCVPRISLCGSGSAALRAYAFGCTASIGACSALIA